MADADDAPQNSDGEALIELFRRATRLMERAARHRLRAGHAQERVLALVRERGDIAQRELLDLLDVRSASLSELLGKLERTGLIARRRDERDRRGLAVSLTDAGSAAAAGGAQDRSEDADALFAGLDPAERVELGRLLAKLAASLQDAPCGRGPRSRSGCGGGCGRHAHGKGRCGGGRR